MKNPLTLAIGLILVAIFVVLLFAFQVRTTEVAVVTTFGKPTRPITDPGPYFKWPWPVQKVHKFDKRIHNFESKFEQVLTSDGYHLLITVYVGWKIGEPQLFFPRFSGSTTRAGVILEGPGRSASRGGDGDNPFHHIV